MPIAASYRALGQGTTGEILGTVVDATQSVVPNATVTIEDLATHVTRSLVSDEKGLYDFTLVANGHYSVRATAAGFKGFLVSDVALSAGARTRVDARDAGR